MIPDKQSAIYEEVKRLWNERRSLAEIATVVKSQVPDVTMKDVNIWICVWRRTNPDSFPKRYSKHSQLRQPSMLSLATELERDYPNEPRILILKAYFVQEAQKRARARVKGESRIQ